MVITSAHYRYNLEAKEAKKGRVSLKGSIALNGKDENGNLYRLELNNIKAVNSLRQSVAKKSYVKEGKTFFVEEGDKVDLKFNNVINKKEKSFDIVAKVNAVGYHKDSGRLSDTETIRFIYEDGKLNVYDMEGEFKVLTL